jgi:hypothetical protein
MSSSNTFVGLSRRATYMSEWKKTCEKVIVSFFQEIIEERLQ